MPRAEPGDRHTGRKSSPAGSAGPGRWQTHRGDGVRPPLLGCWDGEAQERRRFLRRPPHDQQAHPPGGAEADSAVGPMLLNRHSSAVIASVPARCLYPNGQDRAQSAGRGPNLTLCPFSDVDAGAAETRRRKIRDLRAETGRARLNKSRVKGLFSRCRVSPVGAPRAFSRYLESWPAGRSHQGLLRAGNLGARASRPPLQTHRKSLKML